MVGGHEFSNDGSAAPIPRQEGIIGPVDPILAVHICFAARYKTALIQPTLSKEPQIVEIDVSTLVEIAYRIVHGPDRYCEKQRRHKAQEKI